MSIEQLQNVILKIKKCFAYEVGEWPARWLGAGALCEATFLLLEMACINKSDGTEEYSLSKKRKKLEVAVAQCHQKSLRRGQKIRVCVEV